MVAIFLVNKILRQSTVNEISKNAHRAIIHSVNNPVKFVFVSIQVFKQEKKVYSFRGINLSFVRLKLLENKEQKPFLSFFV